MVDSVISKLNYSIRGGNILKGYVFVVQVVSARKGVGKTLLIERLAENLSSRDIRFSYIKVSHHKPTLPSKDVERILEKGCTFAAFYSPYIVYKCSKELVSLEELVNEVSHKSPIVIVEGFRREKLGFRIIVVDRVEDLKMLLGETPSGEIVYSTNSDVYIELKKKYGNIVFQPGEEEKIADIIIEEAIAYFGKLLPGLDCGKCGFNTCKDLAVNIVKGGGSIFQCRILHSVILRVNGVNISLSHYPQLVFKNVILSLVKTLKGIPKDIQTIEIKVTF